MGKLNDLTGQRFGKLTVIERTANTKYGEAQWICQCDCGHPYKVVVGKNLTKGVVKSCGCLMEENRLSIGKRVNHTKHGMYGTRIYNIWNGMKGRCSDISNPNYGGRGITVCDEWQKFELFYEWAMANGYDDTLTLDRINVNGNYEPSNCRWATVKMQCNNTRVNHTITYRGKTQTIKQWADEMGMRDSTLRERIRKGWPVEKALTETVKERRRKI